MQISPKIFQKTIYIHYRKHFRVFPWRETSDPYKILVSEIMLQQTQTDRVRVKYAEWLTHFPTFESLAKVPLQKVLKTWQGLGYNRRALALKRAAEVVVKEYGGKLPADYEKILDLPGIGPYTAGAVMAFAFNKPFPIIETNIRTVYIHFFFENQFGQIHDKELMPIIERTMDRDNPREWYYALMDYGVMLKKTIGNLNTRSKHYTKQTKFIGSNRQIRSSILKAITQSKKSEKQILEFLEQNNVIVKPEQLDKNLFDLEKEGFIIKQKNKYIIQIN
jgi:A/G-specific adenine glycosylase